MQSTSYDANLIREKDMAFFMMHDVDNSMYIPINETNFLCGVKIMGEGSLDELLKMEIEKVESHYGKEQLIEGIVVTPKEPFYIEDNVTVPAVKYKTQKFLETKKKKFKPTSELSEEEKEVMNMITLARLENILSHRDIKLEGTKDFPNVIAAMRTDIEKEFDYEKFYDAKKETLCKFKTFGREVAIVAKEYLNKNYTK